MATSASPPIAEPQTPPLPAHTISPGYRRYLFTLLLCVSTLNYLDRQIINILVEPIRHELQLADWQLGLLTGLSFALFYSVLGLPIARLADRSNRPVIIGVALLVWSGFTVVCGMAQSFVQLLLARIGVGCGEAGGGPPGQSLISDYTTPQNRASALAFYSLGSPIGALLGLGMGAVLADQFGWRVAFYIAGIPGILLGLLMLVTVKEPRNAQPAATRPRATVREAWEELRGKRTFWWICAAGAATSVATYGQGAFWGSFFLRNYGADIEAMGWAMGPLAVVGISLGLVKGLAGIVGAVAGGMITDRLVRRDLRGYCTVPAIALMLASPTFVLVMFAPGFVSGVALLILPVFFSTLIFGPSFAAVQTLVQPQTRATAAAILLFILTLTGLGFGPLLIGGLSDLFGRSMGSGEGLRWAMLMTAPANLVAGLFFWIGRRTLVAELQIEQPAQVS
ncbi:spinster family MFS transporter [Sphingomonas sp.]|uniref:spinster family MFS transporter n=1 Tax=Sphingomonas sp. TaxID=28214 RepID=UPI002DD65A66|nr:MFS transporter [Sphingomonas sp.]